VAALPRFPVEGASETSIIRMIRATRVSCAGVPDSPPGPECKKPRQRIKRSCSNVGVIGSNVTLIAGVSATRRAAPKAP
jgi:hypothetical protein